MSSSHLDEETYTDNTHLESTEKFDHDTDTLLIQAKIAKEAASVLRKKQKEIERKQQQTKSKKLPKCIKKYNTSLKEIREAINRMQDALSEGGFTDMTREGRNKLTRSLILTKRGRDRFQEQTGTTRASLTESTPLKECMMCMKNETKIKALEDKLKSLQQKVKEYEELLQKYRYERDHLEKYQSLHKEKREGKKDALQSTEQFDHDTDTLLIQAKIANEAASVLRKQKKKIEKKQQQTTSKNLPKCIKKYNTSLKEIREAINRKQDALSEGGFTDMTREGRNKLTHSVSLLKKGRGRFQEQTDTKRVSLTESTHLKECMMCMKNEKKRKALEDKLKSLQQNADEYEELLRKYQDERDQHAKYQRLYKEEREGKKDALQRLSAVASSKLRDNNPNIADLSDQNRPTKIAEKMSELYDNQWTDAYGVLQDRGFEEKQIIKTLLDMFMVAYNECSKLASENFFERVQRCIEIPAEEFLLPANYNVVMPDQLKQQVKKFRKAQARHVVKELEMIVRKRINSENQGVDAVYVYLSHCIEIAWYCAVQDPPVVVRRDAPVNFDKNAYKEYTSRGRYTAFVVWPAMYLYDGGALLLKGVAQGSNTRAYGSKIAAASGEIASARNQYKSPSVAYRTTDAKSQTVTMKSSTLDSKRDGAVDHRTNEARINMKPGTRQQQYNARMVFYTDNRTRPGNQTYFVTDI